MNIRLSYNQRHLCVSDGLETHANNKVHNKTWYSIACEKCSSLLLQKYLAHAK